MADIPPALADALSDRYVLERELGRGGMAAVYLAQDLKHGRCVALKVLRPEVGSAFGAARFLREIRVTARLQHPHILPVFDSGETAGQLWYTMPYVEGESLRERFRREGRLPVDEVMQLGREVADALDYAHCQGLVHRDIKPENVLLSRGHALVADFGIARALGPWGGAETVERLTETGLVIGSWAYMSPEQRFAAPVGTASDVFSLGVVLYEALTGDHPFKAPALARTLAAPSRLAPDVPENLDALIFRMLSPDPERRPGAGEAAQALGARPRTHERTAPAAFRPARRRHSVGRADERRQLRGAFEALNAEGGRLLCITGEPGIGKTTLVEDFLAQLSEQPEPPWITRGHCSERLAGSEAYLPFLEALEILVQGEFRDPVVRSMAVLAPSWHAQVVPAIPSDQSTAPRPGEMTAGSQERMKRELGNLLQELSRLHPLIFFFDDIHWADVSTVDLLAYLATRFESTRLLTLVTYRPTELLLGRHPFLPLKLDLQARGLCREIALGFLTPADVADYIDLEFPGHRFAPSFPGLIHARTEGSPLFMVDLLRYLRDRGVIARVDGGWRLGQSVPELERELPESVRGMIEKKIAQLTDAERRLLVMASVQGYRFDSATLGSALALAPAEVEERLQALERVHGFVRLIGEQELPDGTLTLRYQFVHVLYQNAFYASLTPTRRAQSSAAIAQALLGFYGEQSSTIAAELALLFEAARDPSRAAEYFLLAAQNAARLFAYREAVGLAQRGLALVEKLPVTPERTRRESMFWITLGSLFISTKGGGDSEVEAAYRRAQELSKVVGESPHLFTALRGLSEFYHIRGPSETSLSCAEQALDVAQRLGDPALIVDAHHAVAMPLLYLGELERAREHLEQGIALYHPEQRRVYGSLYYDMDPGVGCRYQAGRVLWLLGFPDQARAHAEEGVALAQRISHAPSVGWIHASAAVVHQCRREPCQAEEHAAAAIALGREHGSPEIIGWGAAWHGWAAALQGRLADGIAEIRDGLTALAGHSGLKPHLLALLAEALGRAGRFGEALAVVAEGLAASETGGRYYRAELHRLQGELLLSRARQAAGARDGEGTSAPTGPELMRAEAERCFRQALEIARRQQGKSLELRAATSLARLWQRQGRMIEARELLLPIVGWFTEGFETADLREAQQLIPPP